MNSEFVEQNRKIAARERRETIRSLSSRGIGGERGLASRMLASSIEYRLTERERKREREGVEISLVIFVLYVQLKLG